MSVVVGVRLVPPEIALRPLLVFGKGVKASLFAL